MIDVLINSASRLDCLKPTITSMKAKLKTTKKFRIILHDDVVRKDESAAIEDWAKNSGEIDLFIKTVPAKRLGASFLKCFEYIDSEIFVKWEDDWLFLEEVNLDEIISVMENNLHINQIAFNKYGNESSKHNVNRPLYSYGNIKVTQVNEWVLGPGVWRLSFIKSKWKSTYVDAHYGLGKLGTYDLSLGRDMIWMKNNVGCYFYGGHGAGPFIQHLGLEDKIRWLSPIEGKDY
jgi:hypothetical protein